MDLTVIGGTNADIIGTAEKGFRMKDSNIGSVSFSYGGVGRNIAHNCALLGLKTSFISAVGDDNDGKEIMKALKALKIDISKMMICENSQTDKYLAVINDLGEMACAVNDMRCINRLDAAYIKSLELSTGLIAVDANLSEDVLRYISSLENKIKFLEPVSAGKAQKVSGIVGRFDIIKPNIYEAEALTGIKIRSEKDIQSAGKLLISRGVRAVFITAGKYGVYAFYANKFIHREAHRLEAVNETGAGDAFSAGLLYALANRYKLADTIDFAMKCSELTISQPAAINPNLKASAVLDKIAEDMKNER